ncbi:MAG: CopD family protein [Nitrosopumilaceae archaeon]
MTVEQVVITWAHFISAAMWVGGSLFIGIVLAPLLKTMSNSLEGRLQIMIRVGRRFNKIAIPSLAILIATGIYNSHNILSRPEFLLSSNYGTILVVKIILVIALVAVFVAHVKTISKEKENKIMSNEMSEIEIQNIRKKVIGLGQIIIGLSVAILFMAALLDAGV